MKETKEISPELLDGYLGLLKRRTAVCIGIGIFSAALSIADYYRLFGHGRIESFSALFRAALIVLGLGALLVILNYVKAFDNPGTLKRLYGEEYDEKEQLARKYAGLPFTAYFSAATAAAGIICAYFSRAAFLALYCAAAVMILSSLGVRYAVKNLSGSR